MTAAISVIERLEKQPSVLRAAMLRGSHCAVHAILTQCGPRGATLLAWVALAARPGTALADRIEEAATSAIPVPRRRAPTGRGSALLDRIRQDDAALMAFSRGMAVLHADDGGGGSAAPGLARLAEWQRDDPASLMDFALVGLMFGVDHSMPEIIDAMGEEAANLLLRTPRLSRRSVALLSRERPHVMARLIVLVGAASRAPTRDPRLIDLLQRLAAAAPDLPVGPGGRTAIQQLAAIARDRDETVARVLRAPAIEALDRLGWGASVAVAGEVLATGFSSPADPAARPFAVSSHDPPKAGAPGSDRRLTVAEAVSEARRLLAVLGRHRSSSALDHLDRAGRRHRLVPVRRGALAHLIAGSDDPRRPVPPGRALALAHAQLDDPTVEVALPAVHHLQRRLTGPRAARAILRAIPGMHATVLQVLAARLAWELPLGMHEEAVRRLTESAGHVALLTFLVSASHRTRGDDLFTGVEGENADVRMIIDDRELAALDRSVEWWLDRLRHCLVPLLDGMPPRVRWWSSSDLPIDNGLPAKGWSPHGRTLVRAAARHYARESLAGGGGARGRSEAWRALREQSETDPASAPEAPPVSRASADLVHWTILHALRGDPATARLRVRMLARGIQRDLFRPRVAVAELAGMQADPITAAVIDLDAWRELLRGVIDRSRDDFTALLISCAEPLQPRRALTPWLMGELVALHAGSRDPGPLVGCGLPPASTDPSYDRRFVVHRPVAMPRASARGSSVALHMHLHVRAVLAWLGAEGQRLLGCPVAVRLTRQGAGHTSPPAPGKEPTIHVSPDPLFDLGPRGAEVILGVGLHEFGHQLYDYREPGHAREHRRVQRLGLATLQNLLCDERLERRLRSQNLRYGRLLDRSLRHHFHRQVATVPLAGLASVSGRNIGELRSAIAGGILPSADLIVDPVADCEEVRVPSRDLLRLPGLGTPWQFFTWGLRAGISPAAVPCGRARAALALIPTDLKDLTLRQIGGLCERVAEVLGGVEQERARRQAMREWSDQAWQVAAVLRAVEAAIGGAGALALLDGEPAGEGEGGGEGDAMDDDTDAADIAGIVAMRRSDRRRRRRERMNPDGDPDAAPEPRDPLPVQEVLPRDPAAHRTLIEQVRPHVVGLKRAFDRLGVRSVDETASRRGHRLDLSRARRAALAPCATMLVARREVPGADCHLGILIDRSGSMAGPKMHQARCFGALVAEAARSTPGIDGWVAAFDDDTWVDLGGFRHTSVASLEATGGNNDAAALVMAGRRMQRSRRRRRVLVLISDGQPTECTVEAFHDEAARLERDHGIAVIHVVIERIPQAVVLPRSVNLAGAKHEEAVRRFAQLIGGLVRSGRGAVSAEVRGRGRSLDGNRDRAEMGVAS